VIIKSSIFNDRSGGEGFLSHERDTVLGQDWLDRFVGKGYCGLLVFAVAREMYRWTLFEIEGSALEFLLAGELIKCILKHTISMVLGGGGDFRQSI